MSSRLAGVSDDDLEAFAQDVRTVLQSGDRYKAAGFGTFTTCTRKAAAGRPECTMAMFRASPALREHITAGEPSVVEGPHAAVVAAIIAGMQQEPGVDVPKLGRFAAVVVAGKKPRLIFHASGDLNDALTGTSRTGD